MLNLNNFKLNYEHDNKVLVVTFNRPPVNAFSYEAYEEVSEIVDYVKKEEGIGALVFRAEGKVFSAGADIKELAKSTAKHATERRQVLRKAGTDFQECPVPVISAVHGGATGAGATFSASADFVIASPEAFYSLPEIDVGVVGGAKELEGFLPIKKVKMMALTGEKVYAEEIHRLGGIEKVVSKEELYDTALNYAKTIADKGIVIARKWKEALIATAGVGLDEGNLIEQGISQELGTLLDKKQGE